MKFFVKFIRKSLEGVFYDSPGGQRHIDETGRHECGVGDGVPHGVEGAENSGRRSEPHEAHCEHLLPEGHGTYRRVVVERDQPQHPVPKVQEVLNHKVPRRVEDLVSKAGTKSRLKYSKII